MRFDRRQNYPLQDPNDISITGIFTDIIAGATIVPQKVGGVIKARGQNLIPMNRNVGTLTHPYLYKIPWGKFTRGGGAKPWGRRPL